MSLRLIWLMLSLMLPVTLLAQDSITASRQSELSNLLIQDCGSCHGLKFRGGLGPPLLPEFLSGKSLSYLTQVILNGRPGTAMPPWNKLLSAAEARWMAERLLQGKAL